LQSLREIPYSKWRDTDAEDPLRFTSLRLHEAGMIKTSPNTIRRRHRLALLERTQVLKMRSGRALTLATLASSELSLTTGRAGSRAASLRNLRLHRLI
jgi:hypothetical protein